MEIIFCSQKCMYLTSQDHLRACSSSAITEEAATDVTFADQGITTVGSAADDGDDIERRTKKTLKKAACKPDGDIGKRSSGKQLPIRAKRTILIANWSRDNPRGLARIRLAVERKLYTLKFRGSTHHIS